MDYYERRHKRNVAWVFVIVIVAWVLVGLFGCTTVKYVPVETVRTDSIEKIREVVNNVYVKDSTSTVVQNDTVWRDRWRIIYRDRHSADTIYIDKERRIEVPVEVEKKLSWWQQAKLNYAEYSIGIIVILLTVIAWIVKKKGGSR